MDIGLTIPGFPPMVFTRTYPDPSEQRLDATSALVLPIGNKINHLISNWLINPTTRQVSPRLFFSMICSSNNSDSTSCFWLNFASKTTTFCASCFSAWFCLDTNADAPR